MNIKRIVALTLALTLCLSVLSLSHAQRPAYCTCGHLQTDHDAAGWCLVETADGLDYADTCTLFTAAGAQMWQPTDLQYVSQAATVATSTTCPPPDPGWRALLGGADSTDGVHYSPVYHIPYYPRGFDGDVWKKKVVKKTPNYLRSVGVPEDAVLAFQDYSLQFVTYADHDAHGVIGHKVDAAWEYVVQTHRACGQGTWQYNSVQNPVMVVIEERPFPICSSADVNVNVWAVGTVAIDYGIRICIGHLDNYLGNPTNATYIRDIDSLLRWEMAIAVAKRAGYIFCTTQDETDVQSPCGLAIKTHC
jgi:hypothetical protein